MQAGVVPATMGLEQPNQMINPDLPVILATKQTKLEPDDVLAVSAAGWGGVDSHVVLGFPDQHLLKKSTTLVSESTFNRKSLKAPRLRSMPNEEQRESSLAVLVFTKCASEVLGVKAMSDTDLKMHGLDSKSYLELIGTASKQLSGPMVGYVFLVILCVYLLTNFPESEGCYFRNARRLPLPIFMKISSAHQNPMMSLPL